MSDPVEAAMEEALRCRQTSRSTARVVGNGQEPAAVVFAVGDVLGDALVRPGRAVARIALPRRHPAASPPRQASSVADMAGKTSAQRWHDTSAPAKAQVSELIEYPDRTGEVDLVCI